MAEYIVYIKELIQSIGMTIADIIDIVSLVFIAIGGIFALCKWNFSLKLKRSEYIKGLIDGIRENPIITFYIFDYNKEWYNEEFHGNKGLESKIDYTLSQFSYICYLKNNKIITDKEFRYFTYEIERILRNQQFQSYMYNLYHFSQHIQQPMPFVDLFKYAKKNDYFDTEFWNKRSKQYPHYLNFNG